MSETPAAANAGDLGVCPVCERLVLEWRPGPGGRRPKAACPHCASLERHRFLALLLQARSAQLASATVLEVAPQQGISRLLRSCATHVIGMDVDPRADGRDVDVVGDLCAAPFSSGSLDLVVCYHVFEHIPDDLAAMRELARILAPGGLALVQVPRRSGTRTDEDPSAPASERVRRFGQADHVRYYGDDFEARLEGAGLRHRLLRGADLLDDETLDSAALLAEEPVWYVTRADASGSPDLFGIAGPSGDHSAARDELGAALTGVLVGTWRRAGAELALQRIPDLERQLRRARRDLARRDEQVRAQRRRADRWERDYRRLRSQLPVRALAASARAGREARTTLRRWALDRRHPGTPPGGATPPAA